MSAPPNSQLLTLDEVAAALGVSRTTVEDWVRSRSLGSFKKGKLRKVDRAELARFILANSVRSKRPDWCTEEIEGEFRRVVREIVQDVLSQAVSREGAKGAKELEEAA